MLYLRKEEFFLTYGSGAHLAGGGGTVFYLVKTLRPATGVRYESRLARVSVSLVGKGGEGDLCIHRNLLPCFNLLLAVGSPGGQLQ